jgi:small subunit ribosomal protein S6
MPFYETVFLARQDLSEAQVNELTEKLTKVLKDQGGKILKTEQWGLRTLAYKMNKSRKAHYTLIESDAPGTAIIELERIMRIEEDVMRSLSTRIDAPSKGPSAIIDKTRDRDDSFNTEKEAA